jgi:hypothetical protein
MPTHNNADPQDHSCQRVHVFRPSGNMRRMTVPHLIWPLLLFAAASLPASAEIYRWTDAEGHIHFGDRAPAQGAAVQQIAVPAASATSDPELQRHREQSRKLLEVWDAERRDRREAAAAAAVAAAERDQACAQLRTELERARHAAYLVRNTGAGAREVLGSAEREQYERGLADALAAHCP